MTSVPPRPVQSSRYYAEGMTIAGKYELVRPLGEGGMGSVWVARNVALESQVALKLLRAEFDAEDAGERLLLEARAAARLGHRAIVRIFDFGHTSQGDPFIVMELLEGETVASLVAARGRLAPAKAVQMILPVLDALSAAHGRGIVHRDLKPENIFLARETRRTQPKIVDFGIAKLDQGVAARNLTLQGTVLGSPGYMAPEQARGSSAIDHRADIWAACVVVYECVTAQSAFQGDNYNSLMRAIIEDRVVPITELAAGDASLWAILEKGLQKDPNERWQTARELGVAFVEWLLAHGIETDIAGEPVRGWLEPDSSKSRDLLSVPPASIALQSDRSGLNVTRGDTPPGAPSSFRPSPESTSAVVRTSRPHLSTRVPFAAAVLLLVLGAVIVITLATRGHTTASAPASSPVVGATAHRAPDPVTAPVVTPEPRPTSPGPAVEPNTTGAQPAAQPPTKAQPAPRAARRPPPTQKLGAPPSGRAGPDLKDPY
jgi:eukaryotic-like serine/threonine-protein kinase